MSTEACCNKRMLYEEFLFRAKDKNFLFDVLRKYKCKVCSHQRWQTWEINRNGMGTEASDVPKDQWNKWNSRFSKDFVGIYKNKQTRGMMHIGGKSKFMAGDTAKIYKAILKDYGVVSNNAKHD